MTPISLPAAAIAYELAVLALFVELPETPLRPGVCDQLQARRWFERDIALPLVETALLLGSLRRLQRPAQAPRLPPIRSLGYFQPVVEEVLAAPPVSDSYRDFLRRQLQPYLAGGSHAGA